MKNKQKGNTIFSLLVVLLWLLAVIGWVLNIVTIAKAESIMNSGGLMILRVIGIFVAPLGAVLGFV